MPGAAVGANDHIRMGPQIAALRRARGWSQAQLAEVASLHLRTVQRAEGGRCRAETLMSLASALDADVRDLLPASPPRFAPGDGIRSGLGSMSFSGRSLLTRIPSGKALLDLLAQAVSWQFDHDVVVGEDAELVALLFQAAQGFASLYPDLQPGERVRASALLHERVQALEQRGFHVMGCIENRPLLVKPGHPIPRPVAVIAVHRPPTEQRPPAKTVRGKRSRAQ